MGIMASARDLMTLYVGLELNSLAAYVLASMLRLPALRIGKFVLEYTAPRIVARQDLRLWHSVGTLMYAAQWLCAGASLWRMVEKRSQP